MSEKAMFPLSMCFAWCNRPLQTARVIVTELP